MENKKTLYIVLAAVIVVILAVAVGYFYWQKSRSPASTSEEQALEQASEAAGKITESVTQGVLPSIDTNPLEKAPDINPAGQANPFKNIKTNPFE